MSSIRGYRARRVVNMKVLALAVLVGSLLWADLEQRLRVVSASLGALGIALSNIVLSQSALGTLAAHVRTRKYYSRGYAADSGCLRVDEHKVIFTAQ